MITLVKEDFKDLELTEFPYDKMHSALGEYHYVKPEGYYGNWYDPICLHQWRSTDGSWLVTSDGTNRYLEQNRGDNSKGAFKNVFSCLVHKQELFNEYTLEFDLRIFEIDNYAGMAFNYLTSRNYDFVGIKGNTISLYHRSEEDFIIYDSKEFNFDDLKTYHFKVIVSNTTKVYLNDELILEANIPFKQGLRVACVSKSACRYSNILVSMDEDKYNEHLNLLSKEDERINNIRKQYPELECIKKIDLKNFGSGRQIRIVRQNNKTLFVIAQHQKRMVRDGFARISCLTCFDINGNILWQKGEPNSKDNSLISADLPFQISDINNDGKLEIIYSVDFEVIIADLLTGNIIKKMPTPIIKDNPLFKNNPYYRLNVDAIRVADFSGLGYKSDFIIKDRYQNVLAYDYNFNLLWQYNHKNTGHFPYIADFNNDGKDEIFIGYDLVNHDGKILFSLPMNSDHTDEIIWARLNKKEEKKLVLASGNEGMNIVNLDGTIFKHNEIGHAQRISVAKYKDDIDGLQIMTTTFWGSDGIIAIFDHNGNKLKEFEQRSNGNLITPVNYDGKHVLSLLNSSMDGGLINGDLEKVVIFPNDGHPTLTCEVYDIDDDGIDEIICFDEKEMWIYKSKSYITGHKYNKYPDNGYSNYRGEYLIPYDYE